MKAIPLAIPLNELVKAQQTAKQGMWIGSPPCSSHGVHVFLC